MADLWKKLPGTAEAELCGPEPEALLERCRAAGLQLWDISPLDKCTLRIVLWQRDLTDLEQLCAAQGFALKVRSLRGGSRNRELLRRRKGLLLGILLAVLLLFASSLFVWQIEVTGCEQVSAGRILRALAACGVEPGAFRPAIDPELVKSRVLTELPELEWLTVNISGSRARVLLREREERPKLLSEMQQDDLCAARSGIVLQITALSGQSRVEPGDAVLEGEILISAERESLSGDLRQEPALGEVQAETWYEISSVCPLEMLQIREKNGSSSSVSLQIGKKRWILWPGSRKGLDECDKIVHEYTLGMDGLFSTPLRLIRTTGHPRAETELLAPREEEMKAALLQGLEERIEGKILDHAFSVGRSDGLLIVTLRARCLENIARASANTPREDVCT